MRFLRRLLVLAVSLTAVGALSAPAAFATRSVWAKGGQPTCTVTSTSQSSSSTICTGTLSGENGVQFTVNLAVSGVAVYQCADSAGATVPGQDPVRAQGGSTSSFTPSSKDSTFTTDPAILAAPSATSASQAGCADGTTPVDPTLTTTKIELWLATVGDGPILATCAFDPNGLSGTVLLTATC
jgi:hypothetical protein